jgi:hypothetical protein
VLYRNLLLVGVLKYLGSRLLDFLSVELSDPIGRADSS